MTDTLKARFKAARERAGLAHDQFAWAAGISTPSVWDIESIDDELTSCYSPRQIRTFLKILAITPSELFGRAADVPPLAPASIVQMIKAECQCRRIALEQFEDIVGWNLSPYINSPELLLDDMSLDGLSWLCEELKVDWLRVL